MARDFDRQVAELQVRAAVLNRFTRRHAYYGGYAINLFIKRLTRPSPYFCNKAAPSANGIDVPK
jgi:hypothetical protein